MKPADPREAMQIALFNARRLVRDLGMLAPDGRVPPRGVGGSRAMGGHRGDRR